MRERRQWTAEEDIILRREASLQIETGQLKQWNLIAAKLAGRTNKDCRKRWTKLENNVIKGAWSAAEDEKLHAAVKELGCKWTRVAKQVGTRHAEQCAKRWQNYSDPNVDHSKWDDENDKLLSCVQHFGRNWTTIREKRFPNRSTTDLKNRYNSLIRKQRRALEGPAADLGNTPGNPLHIGTSSTQKNTDDQRNPQFSEKEYNNDIRMGDEDVEGELVEEEDAEQEDEEEVSIERIDRPAQTSHSPLVDLPIQALENESDTLPCNTLDYADIERQCLEFQDFFSNPQSPKDLSSSIKNPFFSPSTISRDSLSEWDSSLECLIPPCTETPLSTDVPSPSSQTKSYTYSGSHPQSKMIQHFESSGHDNHEILFPPTSDSGFWMNTDLESIHASLSQTTLVLENVDSTTLNNVLQLLIASGTKMTMKR